jgi:hypothetical protein
MVASSNRLAEVHVSCPTQPPLADRKFHISAEANVDALHGTARCAGWHVTLLKPFLTCIANLPRLPDVNRAGDPKAVWVMICARSVAVPAGKRQVQLHMTWTSRTRNSNASRRQRASVAILDLTGDLARSAGDAPVKVYNHHRGVRFHRGLIRSAHKPAVLAEKDDLH